MLQFSPIFMTPGYTKHHKNQMLQFFLIFMTPGNTKLHYNQMLLFSLIFMTPGNTKLHYNKMLQFSLIFNPGYMKHHKNQILIFLQSSIGVRILPTPASSPPRLLSSTRFPATCALVGNRATKVRL